MSVRVLGSDAARAVGRFDAKSLVTFRAASMPDAPFRALRSEAVADEMLWRSRGDDE